MATTVTHIVDPNSGAGFDYDSLYDWEAGEQGDLTGVRDEIAVATCRCTGGTADTTNFTIDGWTTSATQYIKIWTDPAESYRHSGKWGIGNKYRLEVSVSGGTDAFIFKEDFIIVEGLQFQLTASSGTSAVIWLYILGATTVFTFQKNIVRSVESGTFVSYLLYAINITSGAQINIFNNAFYDFNRSSSNNIFAGNSAGHLRLYNNTFHNCTGVVSSTSRDSAIMINCLFDCGAQDSVSGTWIAGTNCNASANSSLGYTVTGEGNTGDRLSQTFTFVDPDNGDFHLAANDAGALDYGLGTNVKATFADDIDGQTRPATDGDWDIGADEYVAAGPSVIGPFPTFLIP